MGLLKRGTTPESDVTPPRADTPAPEVAGDGDYASLAEVAAMKRRLKALEGEVQESRQMNRRLADVVDIVVELLVPAMDRDDERVTAALARLRGDEAPPE
jgi:hypothetical protein